MVNSRGDRWEHQQGRKRIQFVANGKATGKKKWRRKDKNWKDDEEDSLTNYDYEVYAMLVWLRTQTRWCWWTHDNVTQQGASEDAKKCNSVRKTDQSIEMRNNKQKTPSTKIKIHFFFVRVFLCSFLIIFICMHNQCPWVSLHHLYRDPPYPKEV